MRLLLSLAAVLVFAGLAPAQYRCGGYSTTYQTQTYAAPTYAAPTYQAPALVVPAAIFVVPGSPTVQLNLTTYSAGYTPVYAGGYAPAVTVFQVLPPVQPTQPTQAPPPAAPVVPPAK